MEVDLNADDGDGSGVRATEIRVDGGEWQPYVEEETILNSAADLERWAQAGPGSLDWFDQEGGFARTIGGFGMPWYPVKDYGDFSLKLQWRDSSTGASGNSGVFVRFPDPERGGRRGRRPSATRARSARPRAIPPGWRSSAATRSRSTTTRPLSRRRPARSTTSRR